MQTMREMCLQIMGAKTFRDMASHWPYSTEIYAPLMNEIPKVVFSHDKSITSRETAQTKEANTVNDTRKAPPLDAATVAKNERIWKDARVVSGALANDIAQRNPLRASEIDGVEARVCEGVRQRHRRARLSAGPFTVEVAAMREAECGISHRAPANGPQLIAGIRRQEPAVRQSLRSSPERY